MNKRFYLTNDGAVDLEEVTAIQGDSIHSTVVLRGGAKMTFQIHERLITNAWMDYQNSKTPKLTDEDELDFPPASIDGNELVS